MLTSLASLFTQLRVKSKLAMTGEITLLGKVLPIGGLKEKVLAAMREGVEHVVVPEKNRHNFEAIPAHVRKKMKATFVSDYSEVFAVMFKDVAAKMQGSLPPRVVSGAVKDLAS